jgi:hypothetical protein
MKRVAFKLMSSIAVGSVYKAMAGLSDEEKQAVLEKVKAKLQEEHPDVMTSDQSVPGSDSPGPVGNTGGPGDPGVNADPAAAPTTDPSTAPASDQAAPGQDSQVPEYVFKSPIFQEAQQHFNGDFENWLVESMNKVKSSTQGTAGAEGAPGVEGAVGQDAPVGPHGPGPDPVGEKGEKGDAGEPGLPGPDFMPPGSGPNPLAGPQTPEFSKPDGKIDEDKVASGIASDIGQIAKENNMPSDKIVELFQGMVGVLSHLITPNPILPPTPVESEMIEANKVASDLVDSKGIQVKHKDKDLMADGCDDENRPNREPEAKPARARTRLTQRSAPLGI